jgi:hypothetical protein
MTVIQVESDDRESVERQVLASLWGREAIRLTASVVDGRYVVSMHSTGDEPDSDGPTAAATPRA